MNAAFAYLRIHAVLITALLFQSMGPQAMAAASPERAAFMAIYCGELTQISAEKRAAMEDLLQAAGLDIPAEPANCPTCVHMDGGLLATPPLHSGVSDYGTVPSAPSVQRAPVTAFVRCARLGRAPPAFA